MNDELTLNVRRPARYMGSELHAARNPQRGDLRVGLAFPDLYEVGMSHLGLNLLYDCLNRAPGLFGERVFMPDEDLEGLLRERAIPLTTLETKLPLGQLDVLGFSLAYELTYTNVLGILDLGGIPLRSSDRSREHPIVIAGGPCAFNPEPLGSFIDAFVVGEAEFLIVEICRTVGEWKASGNSRQDLLRALDRMGGIYVPSLFEWRREGADGRHRLVSLTGRDRPVRKCEIANLDDAPYPASPLVPFARIVHDRISIEAARGCPHACRFCQASNLYRPYRERSPDRLREIALQSLEKTGYEQVSLLALSIGDHSCIGPLVRDLMQELVPRRVSLSLPSLRVGSLEDSVVEEILRVRKTGFTLAPEAASPRLRSVVNKTISEEELFRTAHLISRLGWRSLKLYFMIGLPTETEEEVEEIVRLAQAIRAHAKTARTGGFQITVNVSSFVPKAHTPLQWVPQQAREVSEEKQRFLRQRLKQPGFRVKWHDVRLSLLEGIFARGDRNVGDLLEAAYRLGCRRDGWSEYLRFDLWEKAFEQTGVNPADHLDPYPDTQAPLPWDWIDTGMPREWFLEEHQKALESTCSDFSCTGSCDECGVCARTSDGGEARQSPLPDDPRTLPSNASRTGPSVRGRGERPAARLRLQYTKRHPASYLSHLETLTLFHRALRRSKLPIHYTGGEHPHPKMAFSPALPVGVESLAEYLDLWLSRMPEAGEVEKGLNAVLPEGISVQDARPVPLNASSLEQSIAWMEYDISFPEATPQTPSQEDLKRAMEAFYDDNPCSAGADSKEEKKSGDLRRAVKLEGKQDGHGLVCRIHRLSGSTASAMRVLQVLFPTSNRNGLRPRIIKTDAALLPPSPPALASKRKLRNDK
jgi:radical SAM family uncharacterized protein/radical SAM-linked protein